MQSERFDYPLPPARIAQEPLPERDGARLLVLERAGRTWQDRTIRELPAILRPGDLLVFNDTRVIPARLRSVRDASGGQVEIFLLPESGKDGIAGKGETQRRERGAEPLAASRVIRRALTRSGGRLQVGEILTLPGGVQATLLERLGAAGDLLAFNRSPEAFEAFVRRHGEVPLPPYIRRAPGPSSPLDTERYQTIFAAEPGAVAAPTAGLHFSTALLAALDARGVERATITLHVGPGTFKPVQAARIEEHRVDAEPYRVAAPAAQAVTQAKAAGRRVIPVGTTVLRTLEACWNAARCELLPGAGFTDLFVRPPFTFQVADALLTNFHLPRSSLLMLAAAFASPGSEAGIDWIKDAYAHAISQEYRFFSYGDACLIE